MEGGQRAEAEERRRLGRGREEELGPETGRAAELQPWPPSRAEDILGLTGIALVTVGLGDPAPKAPLRAVTRESRIPTVPWPLVTSTAWFFLPTHGCLQVELREPSQPVGGTASPSQCWGFDPRLQL